MNNKFVWIPMLARPSPDVRMRGTIVCRLALLLLGVLSVLTISTGCFSYDSLEVTDADTIKNVDEAEEFLDISGHSSEQEILEGLNRGLWVIPSDGLFRPDEPVTQGDFILSVWNIFHADDNLSTSVTTEVKSAENAILWAEQEGYLRNTSIKAKTAHKKLLTRMDAMEVLYSCSGRKSGVEVMFTDLYDSGFLDSSKIPSKNKQAVYWGFYNVLIQEREPDIIDPAGTVSRGEMAHILIRYMDDNVAETGITKEGG